MATLRAILRSMVILALWFLAVSAGTASEIEDGDEASQLGLYQEKDTISEDNSETEGEVSVDTLDGGADTDGGETGFADIPLPR